MKVFKLALISTVLADTSLHTDGVLDIKQNFENMTKEDQKSLLEKIFTKMDLDKSETIERKEMLDWAWKIERDYMKENTQNWVTILH